MTDIKSAETREYSKGYAAGRRKVSADDMDLRRQIRELQEDREQIRKERVYFHCLQIVLQDCTNWKFGEDEINNAERYSRLAQIFAKEAISRI